MASSHKIYWETSRSNGLDPTKGFHTKSADGTYQDLRRWRRWRRWRLTCFCYTLNYSGAMRQTMAACRSAWGLRRGLRTERRSEGAGRGSCADCTLVWPANQSLLWLPALLSEEECCTTAWLTVLQPPLRCTATSPLSKELEILLGYYW